MIQIEKLLPLLKKGWVAMDEDGTWHWFYKKPKLYSKCFDDTGIALDMFDIEPVKGEWKDILMKCGGK